MQRIRPPFSKMRFNPPVRNVRPRIVQRLLHFGAEPKVVFCGIFRKREWERALIGGSR
jgi:hypothetical protein